MHSKAGGYIQLCLQLETKWKTNDKKLKKENDEHKNYK